MAPVRQRRLADFIDAERAAIIVEWEAFARAIQPPSGSMNAVALRDHADEILTAIVLDMTSQQTAAEKSEKSKGRGGAQRMEEIGQIHAALRIENGFKLGQMVAEYRALRASVLRLWEGNGGDPGGVTRFNESIDEALIEAVKRFTETTEHFRDQSLGILGHDLRNPLAAIVAGATLLTNSEALDDRSVRLATRMLNSANRMNRMIGDLLDLTRTRFGDPIPVVRVPLDLDPLCREVAAELEALRPAGGVRFESEGDLRGEWDGDRVAQLLSNLLRNAVQHGGASDPVTLRARADGDDVTLEVHNSGPPIPPGVLATMFEPMVRHDGGPRANGGLGLGLYIASQVALAHGGAIRATSTDADGTRFTVRLPRHTAAERPAGTRRRRR